MNHIEANRTKVEAEEAARRDFARRLGTYTDAITRVSCSCGLTMSRKDFQEHQEQTHHQERLTKDNLEQDAGESTDNGVNRQRALRRATFSEDR